jgi:hypothetical protein
VATAVLVEVVRGREGRNERKWKSVKREVMGAVRENIDVLRVSSCVWQMWSGR